MDTPTETPLLRPELTPLPAKMRNLPIDERGFPVPWFVTFINGVPDFRFTNAIRWRRAITEKLCWVCGSALGVHRVFILGPMCGLSRTTTEPPSHRDCAIWSVQNCPFLVRPHARRREDERNEEAQCAGEMIKRNPGVTLVWTTRTFDLFKDQRNNPLIHVGDPELVEWFAEGRQATREEIEHSIATGLPILKAMAESPDEAAALDKALEWLRGHMPRP